MRSFLRILQYVRQYWGYILGSVSSSVLEGIFSAISITILIPFLRILFDMQKLVQTKAPELEFSADSIIQYFNWKLGAIITDYGKLKGLMFICILVVVFFFLKNMFLYVTRLLMAVVRNGVVRDIRDDVFKKVLHLPVGYFTDKRKGDIVTRATADVQEIEVSIMSMLQVTFRSPIKILSFLAVMLYMSYQLTLFVLILLPVTALIVGRIGKTLKKTSMQGQERLGVILSIIDETLTGQRIVKAFNAIGHQLTKFREENNRHYKIMVKMLRRRDLSSPMSEFLGITVVAIVLYFGGRLVLSEEIGLAPENFITFMVIFSQIISPAKSFSNAYYHIQRGLASVERIEQVLETPVDIKNKPGAKPVKEFKKGLRFEGVYFRYEKDHVLQNINLDIEKGKMVAIVGPSGAGKSTLLDLIPRFYDPDKGKVLLDGRDIRDLKIEDVRAMMGIVTQEAILFNETVFNNIAFGVEGAHEEDVKKAAQVANAHRFISRMPQGYQTNVGDQGGKLSGGQRQRIAIARAVLKNPPILLLDEATSSLDTKSEQLVQEALLKLMENRTSVVIAHRLSTIQDADRIVVLEEGRIIEKGDHHTLLEKGGMYQKLVELQAFG